MKLKYSGVYDHDEFLSLALIIGPHTRCSSAYPLQVLPAIASTAVKSLASWVSIMKDNGILRNPESLPELGALVVTELKSKGQGA